MGYFTLSDVGFRPSPQGNKRQARLQICGACEIGSETIEAGFCHRTSVVHVGERTIRHDHARLICQNYLVDLGLPYRQVLDWAVDTIRDFKGHYRDDTGGLVPVPEFSCILNPGSEWWVRDVIEGGKWRGAFDVPKLRKEAVDRWRLLATAIQIEQQPKSICI